uniref:Uncharacterized protein n=1 Tax=Arundo donax TaxID=35708 RepID=A0A0A9FK60_ARUDO
MCWRSMSLLDSGNGGSVIATLGV